MPENRKSQRGKPFKQKPLKGHVVILKPFLFWSIENGYCNPPGDKGPSPQTPRTPEEIKSIVEACKRSTDRSVIVHGY